MSDRGADSDIENEFDENDSQDLEDNVVSIKS